MNQKPDEEAPPAAADIQAECEEQNAAEEAE